LELPLLSRRRLAALKTAAFRQGVTVGRLLRRLIRDYLAVLRERGLESETRRDGKYLRNRTGVGPRDGLSNSRIRSFLRASPIRNRTDNETKIAREEIFGPVASVLRFKDENDAVLQDNDTTYGLAAVVWTKDISRAHAVARRLRAGTVWVNCYLATDPLSPFGGYKQSGFGREAGKAMPSHHDHANLLRLFSRRDLYGIFTSNRGSLTAFLRACAYTSR
jgi:aldehyde dehydrogenase family protein